MRDSIVTNLALRGIKPLHLFVLSGFCFVQDASALGTNRYVEATFKPGSFALVKDKVPAAIWLDPNEYGGVARAATNLQTDIERVTGVSPTLTFSREDVGAAAVIVGTLGQSRLIEQLIKDGKVDVSSIANRWESFIVQVVPKPVAEIEQALVIVGSDKRGTIFGIYDLSEQIGVSPWHWWADVPVKRRAALFVSSGAHSQGPPAVKYRGIFINDEGPCLMTWARTQYGELNHQMYTNVFELILRLKGNYLWPAMWDNSFATDDLLNPKLADEYGIVMATSHHEPMMRAWKEWERAGHRKGSWDYSKNAEQLRKFWKEGLRRTKNYEKVITLGMRGDGDEPMSETESVALLERIVADQRKMIGEMINPDVMAVPQVWALYKEVQGYYERGMRVPDNVTLLWCDDNWGNLRRLPTAAERKRSGGAGIYYHFDYVGGPRNYKWLNTTPLTKVWEQMNLAHEYGADRIWIVNVGDIKPLEFPIEFFLTLAWDPAKWPKERVGDFGRLWAEREFGPEYAREISDIMARYPKYNGRRKPELLGPETFSQLNYFEADRVAAEWKALVDAAENILNKLPENARDAFYQLVLHPVKASAVVAELYLTVGKNRIYAAQGRASANDLAGHARSLFKLDAEMSDYFNHSLAGGKWNHMMDQTHIGYTHWQQPPSNAMPEVKEINLADQARIGVAIEGSDQAWPGPTNPPVLAMRDAHQEQKAYVDVFNRGRVPFEFSATVSSPWLRLSSTGGRLEKEERLWVSVDWSRAAANPTNGFVTIAQAGGPSVQVRVNLAPPGPVQREIINAFREADGHISMEAEHFSGKTDTATARWEKIPDLGRTLSSMSIFPVTTGSILPPDKGPSLEYKMFLTTTGAVEVTTIFGSCLNFEPNRGVRFAAAFDDENPQVLTIVPKGYFAGDGNRDWEESVKNSVREVNSKHQIAGPGLHTLRIWMVDPGVALQKILVNTGGLRPSYLGPPESFHH